MNGNMHRPEMLAAGPRPAFGRLALVLLLFAGTQASQPGLRAAALGEERSAFFEEQIRPLLVQRCYECHAADTKQKGGLQLDSRAGWAKGGDSGPALVPGDPDGSLLLRAVGYLDPDLQMPPEQRLPETEIALLREWIAMGAPDPRESVVLRGEERVDVEKRKREHWAWQPITKPVVAVVEGDRWSRTDIDRFVFKRLREKGIDPSAGADKRVLLRRVYFDLIGLPPAAEAVEGFVRDESEDAYERVVEGLLGSARFGERWAQHWLDLMRYAETYGHEQDFSIPEAWRYRDYVIRAFNADVPYDKLLVEHIAGDLVNPPRLDPATGANESIQGTGHWHLGEATHSPVDIRGDEALRVANQIDVFSKAFLGLTVSCARCHDHKFDAITAEDYYALFGYLQSSSYYLADVSDPGAQEDAVRKLDELKKAQTGEIRRSLAEFLEDQADEAAGAAAAALRQAAGEAEVTGDDGGVVRAWREELKAAEGSPESALHAWASAARHVREERIPWDQALERTSAEEAARRAALSGKAQGMKVVRTVEEGERNYVREEFPFDPARDVIVDYADMQAGEWIAAGKRFGDGPAAAGDLVLQDDRVWPVARIVEEPAAEADLLSARFTGMIRTPTFEVTSDRIWLRYAGEGRMFVAVDSHRVCEGPLHSQGLKRQLDLKGSGFGWVSHDLREYIGHRVHLEFTPGPGFALSRVLFSEEEPVRVEDRRGLQLASLSTPEEATSRAAEGWRRVARAFGEGSTDSAVLQEVNWLLAHLHLLPGPGSGEDWARTAEAFAEARTRIARDIPEPVLALALIDGSAENEPVHVRGNHRNLGPEAIERRFLEALGGKEHSVSATGSGRLELARQLASPANPFTARVFVNRLWHHLFGRGLVETVDNFGATGAAPSHPELLDWLAADFMRNGWSLKQAIRQIVLSSVYRQSSEPDVGKESMDPENILLHRMPVRRMEGEVIRDTILAVSGRLDYRAGGPSIPVHIPEFLRTSRSPGRNGPLDGEGRRSVYLEARRNHPDELLAAFDKPTPFTAIGKRNVSNSPAQPLILLNSPFVHEQARLWARLLLAIQNRSDGERIAHAYRMAFGRAPEDWERREALAFLEESGAQSGEVGAEDAWTALCHTWFNVKEFTYVN